LLLGLMSIVGTPYTVLMPIFATNILHGNARTLGVLMGATGIGALSGALLLASLTQVKGLGKFIFVSCAGFGASLIFFSFSRWYAISVALLVPVGFCMMVQMASCNTLIQAMAPDALRGRIMAVYSMMFMGMAPLGALLAGAAADRITAPWTVALGGSVAIVAAIVFARHLPKFRVAARQLILAQGMAAGEPAQELNTPAVT
jgi:MFS family permease